MELKDKIKTVISSESTKSLWRNEHNSPEWILANEVALIIMGERLNKAKNCGCLNDLFIILKSLSTKTINLKTLQMENKFKLRKDALIFIAGSHYSHANITDKKSIEILSKFPAKISDFVSYPENWEELTEKEEAPIVENATPEEGTTEEGVKEEVIEDPVFDVPTTEAVKMDVSPIPSALEAMNEEQLRILCTKLAEETEGLRKLNHKALKPKMIEFILKNSNKA